MRDDDVLASARRFLDDDDGIESSTSSSSSRGDAALEATTRVTGEGFHRVVDVRVSGVERVDDAIAVAVDVRLSRRFYVDADETTTTTKTRNAKTKKEESVEWTCVASGDVDVERMAKYASESRATCARMLTREETLGRVDARARVDAHARYGDATPGGGARGEMVDDVRAMVMTRDGSWTRARSRAIGEAWMVPVGDANDAAVVGAATASATVAGALAGMYAAARAARRARGERGGDRSARRRASR